MPPLPVSGIGHSPFSYRPSLWHATGACGPFSLAAAGAGVRAHHQPDSTHFCEPVLRALKLAEARTRGGCLGAV